MSDRTRSGFYTSANGAPAYARGTTAHAQRIRGATPVGSRSRSQQDGRRSSRTPSIGSVSSIAPTAASAAPLSLWERRNMFQPPSHQGRPQRPAWATDTEGERSDATPQPRGRGRIPPPQASPSHTASPNASRATGDTSRPHPLSASAARASPAPKRASFVDDGRSDDDLATALPSRERSHGAEDREAYAVMLLQREVDVLKRRADDQRAELIAERERAEAAEADAERWRRKHADACRTAARLDVELRDLRATLGVEAGSRSASVASTQRPAAGRTASVSPPPHSSVSRAPSVGDDVIMGLSTSTAPPRRYAAPALEVGPSDHQHHQQQPYPSSQELEQLRSDRAEFEARANAADKRAEAMARQLGEMGSDVDALRRELASVRHDRQATPPPPPTTPPPAASKADAPRDSFTAALADMKASDFQSPSSDPRHHGRTSFLTATTEPDVSPPTPVGGGGSLGLAARSASDVPVFAYRHAPPIREDAGTGADLKDVNRPSDGRSHSLHLVQTGPPLAASDSYHRQPSRRMSPTLDEEPHSSTERATRNAAASPDGFDGSVIDVAEAHGNDVFGSPLTPVHPDYLSPNPGSIAAPAMTKQRSAFEGRLEGDDTEVALLKAEVAAMKRQLDAVSAARARQSDVTPPPPPPPFASAAADTSRMSPFAVADHDLLVHVAEAVDRIASEQRAQSPQRAVSPPPPPSSATRNASAGGSHRRTNSGRPEPGARSLRDPGHDTAGDLVQSPTTTMMEAPRPQHGPASPPTHPSLNSRLDRSPHRAASTTRSLESPQPTPSNKLFGGGGVAHTGTADDRPDLSRPSAAAYRASPPPPPPVPDVPQRSQVPSYGPATSGAASDAVAAQQQASWQRHFHERAPEPVALGSPPPRTASPARRPLSPPETSANAPNVVTAADAAVAQPRFSPRHGTPSGSGRASPPQQQPAAAAEMTAAARIAAAKQRLEQQRRQAAQPPAATPAPTSVPPPATGPPQQPTAQPSGSTGAGGVAAAARSRLMRLRAQQQHSMGDAGATTAAAVQID